MTPHAKKLRKNRTCSAGPAKGLNV